MPRNKENRRRWHREYMRMRYRNDPEHRRKHKARTAVAKAVSRGRIKKKPCERCNSPESQAHHDDYDKPLQVRWLCRPCHKAEHNGRWG